MTITYVYAYESETVDCTYSVKGDQLTVTSKEGSNILTRVKDSVIERYL